MFPKPNTPVAVDIDRLKDRLTKAHVKLITHPETMLYGGVIVMGKSEIVTDIPTACTDGIDCFYGAEFMAQQNDAQIRFVVLHEKGHVFLRHLPRGVEYWEEDAVTANKAADYAINGLIMELNDKTLCQPPTIPILYDIKYKGWSFPEIYRDLRQQAKQRKRQQQGQGNPCEADQPGQPGQPGEPLDTHDMRKIKGMSGKELKEVVEKVARAIEQGGLLAGRTGQTVPRVVLEAITPKVDWKTQLQEFVTVHTTGKDDDLSLRRLDRRWLDMDMIMPTTIAETVGEIMFLSDTSGSISDNQTAEMVSELCHLAQSVQPERVRVLWWDHMVHGEQVFSPDQFDRIRDLAKPVGGGGTRVTSCAEYIRENNLRADCLIVMTDGYVEDDIDWQGMAPTLWIVTENKDFNPPSGRVVFID
jgi:predicted metal-dependent peptidase